MRLFCVILVAVGAWFAACAEDSGFMKTDYMKYVQWGDDAVAKNKWGEAITYYEEAMRTEPSNPQNVMLLSNVGMLHHYAGEDSLALHTLSEARAMAPASVVILKNRAQVLADMNRVDDAMRDYDLLLSMDSTYTDAWFGRAALNLRMARYDNAEADALKLLALQPDNLQGKYVLSLIYSNTGRPAEAIPMFTALIDDKPQAPLYADRALCRLQLDELPEAADDIARGLELNPDEAELYYCRAILNLRRFREEDARKDADKAIELGMYAPVVNALWVVSQNENWHTAPKRLA